MWPMRDTLLSCRYNNKQRQHSWGKNTESPSSQFPSFSSISYLKVNLAVRLVLKVICKFKGKTSFALSIFLFLLISVCSLNKEQLWIPFTTANSESWVIQNTGNGKVSGNVQIAQLAGRENNCFFSQPTVQKTKRKWKEEPLSTLFSQVFDKILQMSDQFKSN